MAIEISVLDSLYRRIAVVDVYISLVWTERFNAKGDFELHTLSTLENRKLFVEGVKLVIPDSYRVMTVEEIEDTFDEEGKKILKITGPSLEDILEHRLAMAALTDLATDPQWILEGTPKEIATQMFHDICVTGILNAGDIIDGVTELNIFPSDTIPEPLDEIIYVVEPMTLYKATKDLCDLYMMGFRLVRDHDTTLLYYDVYMGCDRSTEQTTLPPVIFSIDLENMDSQRKLVSSASYKNAAYVVSPVGHEIVYPQGVDPLVEGFERRVLLVKADDITDVVPADATAKMIQRGYEELAKNRQFVGLDGEVSVNSQYVYGTHYNLGDLVTQQDDEGTTAQMQVVEQIFTSDANGDRRYPTLAIQQIITPGSWIDMGPDLEWEDVDPELDWDEMP
jgi:hypothetical protein